MGEMVVLLWIIHRRLGSLEAVNLAHSVLRIGVAAGLMAAAIFGFIRGLPATDPLVITVGGIGIGAVVYVGITILAGSDESGAVVRLVQRHHTSRANGPHPPGPPLPNLGEGGTELPSPSEPGSTGA
jgi:hypothetical protein